MDLTPRAVPMLMDGTHGSGDVQPVVQVADIRRVGNTSAERYRIIVSDGEWLCATMVATQLNPLVRNEEVVSGSIIRLSDFLLNTVGDNK